MTEELKDILIVRNNQQLGPFTSSQVQESINQGLLTVDELAWRPGNPAWKPIGVLLDLPGYIPPVSTQLAPQGYASSSAQAQSLPLTSGNPKSKQAYLILAIFLGGLGIHNFYAGYTGKAIVQLLLTLILCETIIIPIGIWIWALVEGFTVDQDANGVRFSS